MGRLPLNVAHMLHGSGSYLYPKLWRTFHMCKHSTRIVNPLQSYLWICTTMEQLSTDLQEKVDVPSLPNMDVFPLTYYELSQSCCLILLTVGMPWK